MKSIPEVGNKTARFHIIYISQNSLRESATGRTKAEIAAIRHVYLDLDNDGPKALAAIESSPRCQNRAISFPVPPANTKSFGR